MSQSWFLKQLESLIGNRYWHMVSLLDEFYLDNCLSILLSIAHLHPISKSHGFVCGKGFYAHPPLSDIVGEIINRACNKEQSIPDLSLGNQFANNILVESYHFA